MELLNAIGQHLGFFLQKIVYYGINNANDTWQKLSLLLTTCDLCGGKCQQYPLLCQHCFNDLALFKLNVCQGDLLNWPAVNRALPKISIDHLVCLSPYQEPFSPWLKQLKYQGRFEITKLLASLLSQYWLTRAQDFPSLCHVELILAVPLHIKKWQRRGYNQSHLLAKQFAKQCQIPYDAYGLQRLTHSSAQVKKGATTRRTTSPQDFYASRASYPEHILLIDDVITTGATASAIASTLKAKGVKTVTLLTLCLTLYHND